MESTQSSIQALVVKIKKEVFSTVNPYSFVSPSAYDTAWLAMIPDPCQPDRPMFKNCLDWVLNNQREEGFWGEPNARGIPTIDCLPATLACMVALKTWNVGTNITEKGLAFFHASAEKLLKETNSHCPRWFTIVFSAMVELALSAGLELAVSDTLEEVVTNILRDRQLILEREELVDKNHYPPLLSYIEALPSSYDIVEEDIAKYLSSDGSLFQSPSATARAFMITGNKACMAYLESTVKKCSNGVPHAYPMDEELIKLCMVNQIQKLGLAEHFTEYIEEILTQVYRDYTDQLQSRLEDINLVPAQIYKDSLAFQLLRMHGYNVTPWTFCRFLHHKEILDRIERNYENFSSVMLNVYKATNLMFPEEFELQEARSFSRKVLEKTTSMKNRDDNVTILDFWRVIEHELHLPWIARLDHLDHRMWIEENENNALWMGKAFRNWLSSLLNDKLIQVAQQNYEFRQSVYKKELEELKRWSKEWGLSDMGFGREKTTYCYFAIAAGTSLPHDSYIRMLVAKSAIIITVADDFFDMRGSLSELEILTEAVRRWDGEGLTGHSKTIFNALDDLVSDTATKYVHQHGRDITKNLQDIWFETFVSWLMEAKWSKSGCTPPMDEYLEVAMTSIATHTIVLPASSFLNPSLTNYEHWSSQCGILTKLLMVAARLLNDIQSYEKEQKDGKPNLVLLRLKENPEVDIEDSINYVKEILEDRKKELLKHVFTDGFNDLSKQTKHLHLSCLKVFQMFFNDSNRYDSNTEMLQDIQKAIYVPLDVQTPRNFNSQRIHSRPKKEYPSITSHCNKIFKHQERRSFTIHQIPQTIFKDGHARMCVSPKFKSCFI